MAAAAVVSLIDGSVKPLWLLAMWFPLVDMAPLPAREGVIAVMAAMLVMVSVAKSWMLWQVFSVPAGGDRPLGRRVVWLRRLLYLAVADALILSAALGTVLSEAVAGALHWLLWGVVQVLFVLVMVRASRGLRGAALALAGLNLVVGLPVMLEEIPADPNVMVFAETPWVEAAFVLLNLAAAGWQILILFAQRADGRWTPATVVVGWLALAQSVAHPIIPMMIARYVPGVTLDFIWLVGELLVFHTVWSARSAHELTAPPQPVVEVEPGGLSSRGRAAVALAVLAPLAVGVQAEEKARLTYGGGWEGRSPWIHGGRRFGDTKPQDREKAFLCHARDSTRGTPPMFPDTLPDQYVLAYGRRLCELPEGKDGMDILREAGSSREVWRADGEALVFLCPGTVAGRNPAELYSDAEVREAEERFVAEGNARCADPWPELRGRRQGTAAYYLFEGGGYSIYDVNDDPEDIAGEGGKVVTAARGSVHVSTVTENTMMCMTVKASNTAPPPPGKGWNHLGTVRVLSRSGSLGVPAMPEGGDTGAGRVLPDLALKGKGRYRVRVYARDLGDADRYNEDYVEEHLIVVFPDRSGG
ncbi:hypothetical protein [Sinosporangium siamense]|uniref:hypothetical protein n=1 Tax=Sinosporangium siamense TaxID=1367973 RepID=UPI001950DE26|nr:hypothetical protein [Sinosporangium siamense]